jgi:hypothetical protein
MAIWWNSNFKLRKQITISITSFSEDQHAVLQLPQTFLDSLKIRNDYEDIEIVYQDPVSEAVTVLAHKKQVVINEDDETILNIFFKKKAGVIGGSNYYMYFGNQNLYGIDYYRPLLPTEQAIYSKPGFPSSYYESLDDLTSTTPIPNYPGNYESTIFYSQEAVISDSPRFTVTRPTEDWDLGYSIRQGARASFLYSGGGAALRYESGPDRGILKITTSSDSVFLDTYNPVNKYKIYYFADNIISDYGFTHTLEVTGDKSPSSSGYLIRIDRMLYTQYDYAVAGSEEIYSGGSISRYVIGV